MTVATTILGERGLLRLPASVRAEVGLAEGDEVIVIPIAPGRVVLTTRNAIQDEVWAAALGAGETTSMRAARAADNDAVAAKRRQTKARVAAMTEEESERIGTALLTRFGV